MAIKPDLIQFEVNTACNLRCPICPHPSISKTRKPREVSFEAYQRIFEPAFIPPYVIIFSGFSEALLNPQLPQMARFEKERGCNVMVATNAKLLSSDSIERFLDMEIDQFVISLDSPDPEVYGPIRLGTKLESTLRNLEALQNAIARRGTDTRIVLNSVVMRSTARGLTDLLDFMHNKGLEDVCFIKIMKMAGAQDPFLEAQFLDWPEYNALPFDEIGQHAQRLGIRTMRSDDGVLKSQGCHVTARSFYISAAFDVSVCPFLSFDSGTVFGNLETQSIDEIFESEAFRSFRQRFEKGGWLPACEACACLFT